VPIHLSPPSRFEWSEFNVILRPVDRNAVDLVHRTVDLLDKFFNRKIILKY
jgi:hypothetical protein